MRTKSLCACLAGVAIAAFAAGMALAEDRLGMPAMGDSSSPDEHLATSSDPDSHMGHSLDPDDLVVEAGDPDDLVVEAEDPDDLVVESEQLEDHIGGSTVLQDLPDAEAQELAVERETLRKLRDRHREAAPTPPPTPAPGSSPLDTQLAEVHAAKQGAEAARQRVAKAENAYGIMMDTDYPRGEARLLIVDERKLARKELKASQQRYDEALSGGVVGPASD
jgi:hypothetical protein